MSEGSRLEGPLLVAKRRLVRDAVGLLAGAAELLDRSQRFTRRAYALDARGRSLRVDDPAAARFCLAGALLRAEHLRYTTTLAIVTAESAESEDLLEPVLPQDAPTRLRLAMEVLAWASRRQLEALGVSYREASVEEERELEGRIPTVLHFPLLLGLHRRGGFAGCQAALLDALAVLFVVGQDAGRLDRLISDATAERERSR